MFSRHVSDRYEQPTSSSLFLPPRLSLIVIIAPHTQTIVLYWLRDMQLIQSKPMRNNTMKMFTYLQCETACIYDVYLKRTGLFIKSQFVMLSYCELTLLGCEALFLKLI